MQKNNLAVEKSVLAARKKPKPGAFTRYMKEYYQLYLLILPAVVFIFIFCYVPMYGAQIAFRDFKVDLGYWGSPWVGLKYFSRFLLGNNFWRLFGNTIGLSVYSLVAGFPLPIILALMLNELRNQKFKKTVQMITYMPYFISTVAVCGLISLFLQRETGIVNLVRASFGAAGIDFLSDPRWFKTIYVVSGIWQTTGWGTIIYLAALSSVDSQIIEAARIDGANRMQTIWYVNLPTIKPTIVILLVLSAGSLLSVGFEKVLLLQNPLNMESSDVISTYVYRLGVKDAQFSYTTAIGLFNSVVNLIVLILSNKLAAKLTGSSLW